MEQTTQGSDAASEIRSLWAAGRRDEAYALVVEGTKDSLYRYLRSLLRDEDAAREVFQETYLRVFRALGGFRGEASLTTWVLRIGRHLAWNRLRGQKSREARETGLDGVPDPAGEGSDPATRSLHAALGELPPAQREAVALYYLEEFTVGEVAQATGRPANTVKSDLMRARHALRRALDRPETAVSAGRGQEAGS